MKKQSAVLLMTTIAVCLTASEVAATLMLRQPMATAPTLGMNVGRPFFKSDPFDAISGSAQLDLHFPISRQVNVLGAFPVATMAANDFGVGRKTVIGNASIGFELAFQRAGVRKASLTLLTYLPTATKPNMSYYYWDRPGSEEEYWKTLMALAVGNASNYYDIAAYQPYYWGGYANFSQVWQMDDLMVGFEFGPTILLPRGENGESALLMHYGLSTGFGTRNILCVVELGGLFVSTQEFHDFSDRFDHFLAFGIEMPGIQGQPAIYFQRPLDSEYTDGELGALHLRFAFALGPGKD